MTTVTVHSGKPHTLPREMDDEELDAFLRALGCVEQGDASKAGPWRGRGEVKEYTFEALMAAFEGEIKS